MCVQRVIAVYYYNGKIFTIYHMFIERISILVALFRGDAFLSPSMTGASNTICRHGSTMICVGGLHNNDLEHGICHTVDHMVGRHPIRCCNMICCNLLQQLTAKQQGMYNALNDGYRKQTNCGFKLHWCIAC